MQTEIDTAPLQSAGQDLVTKAESTKIASNEQAQAAGELLVSVKALVKKIEGEFKDPKQRAHEAHKSITALEKRMLELPQKAETILKRHIGEWQMAEQKRIREEERRLQEEANRRAEENRRHEEAEARRIAEEKRLQEAVELEASGQVEAAEEAIAAPIAPVYVPPPSSSPVVRLAQPKIAGVSTRMRKSFRIVDVSQIKREYMIPDETKIRKIVEAVGQDAEKMVGGIAFEEIPETRVGGGRA